MDIAKYVGLFLNKNRYCNLPNLGEFAVVKKPAKHKDGQITAPGYEVNFKFSGGLIDDAFANFVANNERISIASAANAIKDFAMATRATLAEGGTVAIPGFGTFRNINGKNEFEPEANIEVEAQGIPIFKINTAATQSSMGSEKIADLHEKLQLKEPTAQEEIVIKPPTVNWPKVIALVVIVLVVIGGVAAAIWYMKDNSEAIEAVIADEVGVGEQTVPNQVNDTSAARDTANTTDTIGQSSGTTFGLISYTDKASAERKEKQLKGFGHDVSLRQQNDSSIMLTITLPGVTDVEKAKDSLRRFFNPKGTVTVMQ